VRIRRAQQDAPPLRGTSLTLSKMRASNATSRLLVVVAVGAFYATVGIVFAKFAPEILWRRLAWLVSAGAFAAHIAYEHFFRCGSARIAAGQVGVASAIGAFGLAIAANLHGWSVPGANHRGLAIAVVAWPVIVGIPAFIVALIVAVIAKRVWPSRNA
jgi:hypothetical protein